MDSYETLDVESRNGVTTVSLNRPDVYNAFNELQVAELTECFSQVSEDNTVYAVVLTGNGRHFCAGADLKWMQKVASFTRGENYEGAKKMAHMYHTINTCTKPVVGRINGSAFGGGVGLVAVCDVAVCNSDAVFAFSEVNLGIVPAVISRYVLPKIGVSHARSLFTTGERFSAQKALDIGLVHEMCPSKELDEKTDEKVSLLRSSGPRAVYVAKKLIQTWSVLEDTRFGEYTVELIADLRASKEGKEGIMAFLEKRKPKWR